MQNHFQVTIPNWEYRYLKSGKARPKHWEWKDREKLPLKYKKIMAKTPLTKGKKKYCVDIEGNLFVKNTKKAGKPSYWVLNGQGLYNATLNWRLRKNVAKYYHEYFSEYIKEQLTNPLDFSGGKLLSVSCDIYEVKRSKIPDVSNMWPLEKFFEDALQDCGIIPGDDPGYVIESGRKRYHWVDSEEKRKLVFILKFLED